MRYIGNTPKIPKFGKMGDKFKLPLSILSYANNNATKELALQP